MAFFDGQNLYQHAKDAYGYHHPNYDPKLLHKAVCDEFGWIPNLARFYTGVPPQEREPMWAGFWSNRVLAMKRAGVHVTTRQLRYRTQIVETADGEKEIAVPQEKGIDVRMALDIVRCARKREFDVAILFSQDQDLNEIVEEIRDIAAEQEREIEICSAFPGGANATYRRGVDKTAWYRMTKEFYDRCLDHRDYRPANHR
ncbi:NYN domain-containing protein [Maricaulis sp.]|uniref:NYN domain-containing protein n=1 Tax=Maricaulis sp. TaxID=1486257 RepID=UPI0025BDA383|nr:NYN domain-containing protein [Maricaulis sp.]